ncbi:MAG: hypothetical protein HYY50_04400 [Candidatus Kerfeldbacteria bacterium]|nr:hypothetical protein [Candidatus Kerfeldbacteria bacterium]
MPDPKPSKTQKVKEEIKKEVDKIPPTSDQNLLAALSYAWIVSLVMLLARPKDDFVKFHAKQGLVLLIAHLVWIIPILGWILGFLVWVAMIVGFLNAWRGRRYEIPLVYRLSEKIKL